MRHESTRWIDDYIEELVAFPDGLHDQVDASSGAFNKLTEGNTAVPVTAAPAHGAAAGAGQPPAEGQQDAQGTQAGTPPPPESAAVLLDAARKRAGLLDFGGASAMPTPSSPLLGALPVGAAVPGASARQAGLI